MTHTKVERREEAFAPHAVTRIWQEQADPANPYLSTANRLHGYEQMALLAKRGFCEVFFLLFRGELPTPAESRQLEALMIALISPGPRHPATQAAMLAGVGKTDPLHILPIGLGVLGGEWQGAGEVEQAMRFLTRMRTQPADRVAAAQLAKPEAGEADAASAGDVQAAPGFGTRYGGIDPVPQQLAQYLLGLPGSGNTLRWAAEFVEAIGVAGQGWLYTGLAAAVFVDLGFKPRAGGGLFQLLQAPGLLAHGLEQSNKPLTAMPFLDDEHYVIEAK